MHMQNLQQWYMFVDWPSGWYTCLDLEDILEVGTPMHDDREMELIGPVVNAREAPWVVAVRNEDLNTEIVCGDAHGRVRKRLLCGAPPWVQRNAVAGRDNDWRPTPFHAEDVMAEGDGEDR